MRLIGRRNFVRGLGLGAGAALLTPFARALVAEAHGIAGSPRWILMHDDHGLGTDVLRRWIPSNPDLTLPDALPPSFSPLAPWADRMMILDSFNNPFNPGQHGNGWASLSGVSSVEEVPGEQQSENGYPNPGGITIDVLAGELLGDVPFRRLGFGTDSDGRSSDASLNRVPDHRDSRNAFDQILGGIDPGATDAEILARLDRQHSVLDHVNGDLHRMRARLAAPERLKLDQLEDSIHQLEDQLAGLAQTGACSLPAYPDDDSVTAGPHGGPFPAGFFKAMVSIAKTALLCRLTNVIVLRPSPGRRNWSEITGNSKDKHDTSHDNALGDPKLVEIDQFNAGHLVEMISALEAVSEGDGTMFDRTLVTWIDQGGGRHHGGHTKHPVITLGNPSGTFGNLGKYTTFADPDDEPESKPTMNEVFVPLLQALGLDVDTFGDPDACKNPLTL
jgi:hypothetical protein